MSLESLEGTFPAIELVDPPSPADLPTPTLNTAGHGFNIYLCISHGETQYPHSKFFTGQWEGNKGPSLAKFQNHDWLRKTAKI